MQKNPKIKEKKLCNINVILKIISTKACKTNLEEFYEFCSEGNALICEIFPWKLCNASSHMLFGHVCYVIAKNNGFGLSLIHI